MEFIVEKIGMSRTIDISSAPVTLLKVIETKVCEVREDGKALVTYNSSKKINKSIEGQQAKYGVTKEFNKFMTIEVAAGTEAGDLDMSVLSSAQIVKTSLNSKGRGFQGGVKRHGFSGVGGQTHGQHNRGRAPGSLGASSFPSRVLPGMRMAGRKGGDKVMSMSMRVIKLMPENNLILVKGSVPGPKGGYVIITK